MTDSFITHKNQLRDLGLANKIGIEACKAELNEKISILEVLLKNHDNGRRKGFYCLAVNLLDLEDIKTVMAKIGNDTDSKTVSDLFEEIAEQRSVSLKLRK